MFGMGMDFSSCAWILGIGMGCMGCSAWACVAQHGHSFMHGRGLHRLFGMGMYSFMGFLAWAWVA